MAIPEAKPPSGGEVARELESEFLLEDGELLAPLAERMGAVAERLDRGEDVDPEYLGRGVELCRRYGVEVHAPRVRHLLSLVPPALPADDEGPAPRRLRRRERSAPAPSPPPRETSLRELQAMLHEQTLSEERIGELHRLLTFYASHGYGARERFASALHAFVVSELAWAKEEEEYVLRAFRLPLSQESDAKVHSGLAEVARARGALLEAIRAFVAEPLPRYGAAAAKS